MRAELQCPIRITFLADARSPIASNWIRGVRERGHEVQVVSTYPLGRDEQLNAVAQTAPTIPVRAESLISRYRGRGESGHRKRQHSKTITLGRSVSVRRLLWKARTYAEVAMSYSVGRSIREAVESFSPDLVHAMRIPFEGLFAARALAQVDVPLVISVWGNDLTLQAPTTRLLTKETRLALLRADGLHCDCRRDLELARQMGFPSQRPSTVCPGSGGLDLRLFHPGPRPADLAASLGVRDRAPVVVNPRAVRDYVRNDVFFSAIAEVLQTHPDLIVLAVGMETSEPIARLVNRLGISSSVRLLPHLPQGHIADLFRLSDVTLSPSVHDGTPNTLLEAMACGSVPIAGDIASLREWVTDGKNGLLIDPTDPSALAGALRHVLDDAVFCEHARALNLELVRKAADRRIVLHDIETLYRDVISACHRSDGGREEAS